MSDKKLHALRFPKPGAPTMVVLHGLLGSSRNWTTIGRALSDMFDVHALDLRNHGQSFHEESMSWDEMVEDLRFYLEAENIDRCIIVGHSLGGKVAMRFAVTYPELVAKLIVVDIAAKDYDSHLDQEFRAMRAIDIQSVANRKEAEQRLEEHLDDWGLRQFLLTNVVREGEGYRWQMNLEVLHSQLDTIRHNPLGNSDSYDGPTLVVRGSRSNFLEDGDVENMRRWFPKIEEVGLATGHNVHIEDRSGFLEAVGNWLADDQS